MAFQKLGILKLILWIKIYIENTILIKDSAKEIIILNILQNLINKWCHIIFLNFN